MRVVSASFSGSHRRKRHRYENRCQEHAQERGPSRHHYEDAEHRSGEATGFFVPPFLQKLGVHWNH